MKEFKENDIVMICAPINERYSGCICRFVSYHSYTVTVYSNGETLSGLATSIKPYEASDFELALYGLL